MKREIQTLILASLFLISIKTLSPELNYTSRADELLKTMYGMKSNNFDYPNYQSETVLKKLQQLGVTPTCRCRPTCCHGDNLTFHNTYLFILAMEQMKSK